MAFGIEWAYFFIISLESIIGIFTNFFIIFRILFTYWNHRDVSGCEKIIVALCISNLCYTSTNLANILAFNIWPNQIVIIKISSALFVFTFFIIITSAWLTASLCFYYYVKIKNFSSNLLSRLKLKINSLASWMIFMSVLLSFLFSSLNMLPTVVQNKDSANSTVSNTSWDSSSVFIRDSNLYIFFVSTFVPFFISVTTTASTAWSLHLHKLKMAKNQTSSTYGNLRKYEGAVKIMICLLTFYVLIYVDLCLFFFKVFDPNSQWFWGFMVILCSYSPIQSILLSLSTTMLKRAWLKMFNCNSGSSDDDENRQ